MKELIIKDNNIASLIIYYIKKAKYELINKDKVIFKFLLDEDDYLKALVLASEYDSNCDFNLNLKEYNRVKVNVIKSISRFKARSC